MNDAAIGLLFVVIPTIFVLGYIIFRITCMLMNKRRKSRNNEHQSSRKDAHPTKGNSQISTSSTAVSNAEVTQSQTSQKNDSSSQEQAAFEEAQKQNDVKKLIKFALKGYIRDESKKLYSNLKSDDEFKLLQDTLEKDDAEYASPEKFLQTIDLCMMRYRYNDERHDSQKMLSSMADLAYACVHYGYYDDAMRIAQWHDGAAWLAPMGWSGDLKEYIKVAIEVSKKKRLNNRIRGSGSARASHR